MMWQESYLDRAEVKLTRKYRSGCPEKVHFSHNNKMDINFHTELELLQKTMQQDDGTNWIDITRFGADWQFQAIVIPSKV